MSGGGYFVYKPQKNGANHGEHVGVVTANIVLVNAFRFPFAKAVPTLGRGDGPR